MATTTGNKRSLYRAAPGPYAPPPPVRKALAQGTLEDERLSNVSNTWVVPHPELLQNTDVRNLSAVPAQSPAKLQPSPTLSLSETEEDNGAKLPTVMATKIKMPKSSDEKSVLVVDALARRKSPDVAEVETHTLLAESPVKVIRHSAVDHNNNARERSQGSGVNDQFVQEAKQQEDSEHARIITTREVPSINILDNNISVISQLQDSLSSYSEDSSVSTIAGSPVDHRSMAVKVFPEEEQSKDNLAARGARLKSFMGEDDPQQVKKTSSKAEKNEIKQKLQFIEPTEDAKENTSTSIVGDAKKKAKKKKAVPRVVASRYMQATKPPAPPTAKEKVRGSENVSLSQHQSKMNKAAKQKVSPHSKMPKGYTSLSTSALDNSLNPLNSSGMVTSTPMMALKANNLLPDLATNKTAKTSHNFIPEEEEEENESVSANVDYSNRLLQWTYLNAKLDQTMKQQEKEAETQMYCVWQENERLRREIAELELQIQLKKNIKTLDKLLDLQSEGLEPIEKHMAALTSTHLQLGSALDATRHYMPVDGVHFPDNHDKMVAALDESGRLLEEILTLTREQQPKVGTVASEMLALSETVDRELKQRERCKDLLTALSSLHTQEKSLQVEAIQSELHV